MRCPILQLCLLWLMFLSTGTRALGKASDGQEPHNGDFSAGTLTAVWDTGGRTYDFAPDARTGTYYPLYNGNGDQKHAG